MSKAISIIISLLVISVHFSKPATVDNDNECTITHFDEVSDKVKNCQNLVLNGIKVPGGQQLLLNLNEGTTLTLRGRTYFEYEEWKGPLVYLSGNNITVIGEKDSVLDGQGHLWWDGLGTWGNITKPKLLNLTVTNAIFEGINILDCPVACVTMEQSENVTVRNWNIDILSGDEGVAPENQFAHNTDGIGIGTSHNILVEGASVYNQDDCVAIRSGKNITIRNIFCHGSHGLSISVGGKVLEDVLFENSVVVRAENGIHIKTSVYSGEGLIKNVLYRNITLLDSLYYGINIQQNYVNVPAGQPQDAPPSNNTPIYNLALTNIYGNVLSGAVPVFILCAEIGGCFDWQWKDVTIYGQINDNCTYYIPNGYNC